METMTLRSIRNEQKQPQWDQMVEHNGRVTEFFSNVGDSNIKVNDSNFYREVALRGSLGLGESYVKGMWECQNLKALFENIYQSEQTLRKKVPIHEKAVKQIYRKLFKTDNTEVGRAHYDLGNDLYEAMLGTNMTYTCAYWKEARNLEEAQQHKLDLVCRKMQIKSGETILDIGCGWGSFAKYAAENYGAKVVGITISKEQASYARKLCKGLSVEILYQDYETFDGKFDKIISLGMLEHVGKENLDKYFSIGKRMLNPGGLFLVQTISTTRTRKGFDRWMGKYIFPNAYVPSITQLASACERKFVIEDIHNFGRDYALTLDAWYENFKNNWNTLKANYGGEFYRMWEYYLQTSSAAFSSRNHQLLQLILSHGDLKETLRAAR